MHSELTRNEFNIENDWANDYDLSAINVMFESDEEYDHYDYADELIPADDSGTIASRMGALLLAVTGITIAFVWLLYGGSNAESQFTIAQANVNHIYPTPTLIGPVLAETGALSARADVPVVDQNTVPEPQESPFPTQTPIPPQLATPIPTPEFGFYPDSSIAKNYVTAKMRQDLEAIIKTDFPARDYLATHLELTELAQPQPVAPAVWQIGQRRTINVVGEQIEVRLAAAGANAYIWVDSRLALADSDFAPVIERIDNDLYPALTGLFGQERRPGIDNDPRFHIFHLARLDSRELGYFDSSDAYPTEVFAESNQHEAIYLNMDSVTLESNVYYGTLVHELQHLIQWHVDRNETTWLDEGLSQLSEVYTGFNSFSVDDYTGHNHIQLMIGRMTVTRSTAIMAETALFVVYLWEQFGDGFIRALAANRHDGMAAVIDALTLTPSQQSIDDVFEIG